MPAGKACGCHTGMYGPARLNQLAVLQSSVRTAAALPY